MYLNLLRLSITYQHRELIRPRALRYQQRKTRLIIPQVEVSFLFIPVSNHASTTAVVSPPQKRTCHHPASTRSAAMYNLYQTTAETKSNLDEPQLPLIKAPQVNLETSTPERYQHPLDHTGQIRRVIWIS